jgi:hypothetical protein
MKTSLSSVPTQRIARALLLVFAATAVCTFFSACVGTAYRHGHASKIVWTGGTIAGTTDPINTHSVEGGLIPHLASG